jgi:hypothetical protein
LKKLITLFSRKNHNFVAKNFEWSNSFVTLKNDIWIRQKSLKSWIDLRVKMLLTFVNLLKFVSFIEFSLLISFLLLNRFMRFWKKTFHSCENSLNKKQWTFSRLFLSILSLLFSLIMQLMLSYSRWTRVLKIKKKSWWFCATKKNIQCVMKMKSDLMRKKKYDVIKKKCREIFKILKKIHFYFYDVKFILKTNVRVFVDQLNRFNTNLFDAFVTRWLVWIRFFDFEVRYVLDIKQTIYSKSLRRLMILKKSLKKKTLMIKWTFNLIMCACFLSRLQKKNLLRF